MSVNKSFIVKKGIEVSNNLIFANDELNKVGIGSTTPKGKLEVSGDIRTIDLNVSGIATISIVTGTIGTITNISGTNINYGIGTITNFVSSSSTITDIVGTYLNYGIGTFSQLNSNISDLFAVSGTSLNYSGFGTITNLRSLSGIVTNLTGTNIRYTGIGTISNFVSTSSTITNITGTSGTITRIQGTNLNYSGVGTINNVRITAGIISAVSGIITFYGDGSNLVSVKPVPAGSGNREVQFNISGITSASPNLRFINDNELLINNRVTSAYIGVGTVRIDNTLSVGAAATFFSFSNKFLELNPTQNTIQLYSQNYENTRRRWITYPFKPYIHTLADLSTRKSLFITEVDWIISNHPVTIPSSTGTLQDNSGFTTSITASYGYNTDTDIVLHNRLFLGGRHPRAEDDEECGLWISPGGITGDGNSAANSSGPIISRPVIDTYFGDNTTIGALSARMRLSGFVKGAGSAGAEFASINFDSQISPDNQYDFHRGKAKIWAKNVINLTSPKAQYGSSLVFGASKLGPQDSGQNSSTYSDILEVRGDDYLRLLPSITGLQFGGTANAINYDGSNNIRIVTNSSERIVVNSTGRIGIGTTIPSSLSLVSIAGTFSFGEPNSTGTRTIFGSSSNGFILNHNDNSNLNFQTQGITKFRWDHNANALIIGVIQPTGTSQQKFQVDGGAYFQNSVGIGTTNPKETLDVSGNIRVGSSTTQNYISFRGTTGDNQDAFTYSFIGERIWDPNTERSELVIAKLNDPGSTTGPDRIRLIGAEIKFDTYTAAHNGPFHQVTSSANNLNRLVIKSDGTVGIGTETTKALLDVRGEATFGEGVIPSEIGWTKNTNQRVYSFSGNSGTNPADGTILLVNPNVNPSATRVGSLIFGNKTAANPATINAGIKATIDTFTYTNVTNASDTGGYININVKPNSGNLYKIATFDSTELQVFGNVEGSRLISNVAQGTSPLVVTSTTMVQNLNAQYINGVPLGATGSSIPVLSANNTWSGINTVTQTFTVGVGNTTVQLGTDGNIEIRRGGGNPYIDFKDANEDYDIRIQRTGNSELSIIGGQLKVERLRAIDDIGIDGGKSLFFGREESFLGTNVGVNDHGYIIWDDDNNTYTAYGDSTENGCLRIGTENNENTNTSDNIALEPSADLWLNPRSGRVQFHKKNSTNAGAAGGGGNLFAGLEPPSTASGRGQFVMSSSYSDLVIASSQSNNSHGSTITFATYNPTNSTDYRKFVINQGNWGSRSGFLEFGYSSTSGRTNPHSNINDTDTALTIDGVNKRLGVGLSRRSPSSTLDVNGESRFTADNAIVATGTNPSYDVWGGSIEIREIDQATNTQTANNYAPGLTFHWGNVTSAAIKMYSDGSIRFVGQNSGSLTNAQQEVNYRPIYANRFISNIATGSPLIVSSTTKVDNLNVDYLDGYDSSSFVNDTHTPSANRVNLAVGWYTIAVNVGDRAIARFGIRDTQSGKHQSCVFYASHHYGNFSELTVLHSSRYSGNPFRYIRIKEGSTYDGALLQVYIDDASNNVTAYLLGDNFQSSGWVLKDWVPDATNPGGLGNFGALTNVAAQVDIDQVLDGGMVTTGEMYSGGKTTQFRVLNTDDTGTSGTKIPYLSTGNTWSSIQQFYSSMSSQEDYVNSPISIRERGLAGSGDGEDRDSPNLNFHWGGRVSKSLWMGANGYLNWGEYNDTGIPSADGVFRTAQFQSTAATAAPFIVASTTVVTNLNADLLDGHNRDTAANANTVAGRDASGDINVRLIRQTFANQNTISGGMVFRVNDSTDNYLRVCNDTGAIRTFLNVPTRTGVDASGTWNINITGNAASTLNPTFSGDAVTKDNITTRTETGFYQTSSGTTAEGWPRNDNVWQHLIACTHNNDNNYYSMQIAGGFFSQDWYFRNTNDSGTTGWSRILHNGNFNEYSPTRTGTGASGTWNINVSGNAATANQVSRTVSGTNSVELVRGNMADNDQFRILVGGTASNAGYAEIATADEGTEPIYVRQYSGAFSTLQRTAALLDGSGNTTFPGILSSSSLTVSGNITVSSANGSGGGIILAGVGDIVDLNNDGYASMRFSNGVRVYSGNRQGTAKITLGSNGTVSATTYQGDGSQLTGIIGRAAAMALVFG